MKTITYDETKFRLVPVEPTPEIIQSCIDAWQKRIAEKCADGTLLSGGDPEKTYRSTYAAIIAAAPQPECVEQAPDELRTAALELADAMENRADMPLHKWAVKCLFLVNRVRRAAGVAPAQEPSHDDK